jgi:TM2 domain-containing membrane protein YozV
MKTGTVFKRWGDKMELKRTPLVAALLSFLFAGLGQFYNQQNLKGTIFILINLINLFLMWFVVGLFTFFIFWIYNIYDAYKMAKRANMKLARQSGKVEPSPN